MQARPEIFGGMRQLRCFVAMVALAISTLIAANAEASCGDYLHVTAGAKRDHQGLGDTEEGSTSQPLIPRRCNGPNCNRSAPLPTTPAPLPTSSDPGKLAVKNILTHAVTSSLIQVLELRDESPSTGFPFGVKRPPRV
jgi:hypothetical protein